MNSTQSLVKPKSISQLRLMVSLLRKEFKESGYLTGVILILGLATIFLGAFFVRPSSYYFRDFEPLLVGMAKALPVMILLAGASALFAIERENRSYTLLRSLPLSTGKIFWAKMIPLCAMVLLSCLLAWPMVFLVQGWSTQNLNELLTSLPHYAISMVELLLWSLFFSLRENKVIHAIVKSIAGFLVVTNGAAVLSLIDTSNPEMDTFYFWMIVAIRSATAVCLAILIRKELTHWLRDRTTGQKTSRKIRPAITEAPTGARSSWHRLAWLQFRAHWLVISIFGIASFAIVVSTTTPTTQFNLDMGIPSWTITMAFLGAMATFRSRTEWKFLISNGFSLQTIWWVSSATLFAIGLFSAIFFWLMIPENATEPCHFLSFHLQNLLVAFAMGQLASLLCRTLVPCLMLATLFGAVGLGTLSFCRYGLEHQFFSLLLLGGVSFSLVALYLPSIAKSERLDKSFWIAAPLLYGLAMMPLPFQRIYEVPYADVEPILALDSSDSSPSDPDFKAAQEIGDELIKLRNRTRSVWSQNRPSQQYFDLVRPLLDLNVDRIRFLKASRDDVKNIERLDLIRSAIGMAWTEVEEQANVGKYDYVDINRLIMSSPRWSDSLEHSRILEWWALNPATKTEDIRTLIDWLENEQRLFDIYRASCLASYRYFLAALETHPNAFPRMRHAFQFAGIRFTKIPWEVARFKRDVRSLLVQNWNSIDQLESRHQTQDSNYSARRVAPKHYENMIARQIEYFRTTHFWNMESVLHICRSTRLYLAIVLWQREHNGVPPESLDKLVGKYLKKVPVSPFDGEKFYWAPAGFTQDQIENYSHLADLHQTWHNRREYTGETKEQINEHPVLWINLPLYNNPQKTSKFPRIKIRSVEGFKKSDDSKTLFNIGFWILPKRE